MATKDIVSSGTLWKQPNWFFFSFFLLLFFWQEQYGISHINPAFFFFPLGTVREMCPQVNRQLGEMESRLGHESAGWGSTLHLSGVWLPPSKPLRSSMASGTVEGHDDLSSLQPPLGACGTSAHFYIS